MSKIQSNIENQKYVDVIAELITAIELQEAVQRLLKKQRDKNEKLEKENVELKRKNDELKEIIKQHYSYIEGFPKSPIAEADHAYDSYAGDNHPAHAKQ